MKANELMIGDWVQDISFVTIESLCSEDICTYRNKEGFIYTANISNMKPVPLTAEILEKNGYKDERSNYALRYDKYHICIYLADEKLSINSYGAVLDIHCCYVHELQHALKVCGIDKNIVL